MTQPQSTQSSAASTAAAIEDLVSGRRQPDDRFVPFAHTTKGELATIALHHLRDELKAVGRVCDIDDKNLAFVTIADRTMRTELRLRILDTRRGNSAFKQHWYIGVAVDDDYSHHLYVSYPTPSEVIRNEKLPTESSVFVDPHDFQAAVLDGAKRLFERVLLKNG